MSSSKMAFKKRKCKPRHSTSKIKGNDLQPVQDLSEQQKTSSIIDKLAKKYMTSPESTDKRSTQMQGASVETVQDNLYDFMEEESPTSARSMKTKNVAKTKVGTQTKGKATRTEKPVKGVSRSVKTRQQSVDVAALVTPVTRSRKISMSHETNINKPKRFLKPIAQPNLDDISPILRNSASRKNVQKSNEKMNKRHLRSSKPDIPGLETPAISFIEADSCVADNDDSAIFVSPQKRMRFSSGKTSTPAERENMRKRNTHKSKTTKSSAIISPAKATSTPFTQTKPKPDHTHKKSSSITSKHVKHIAPALSKSETPNPQVKRSSGRKLPLKKSTPTSAVKRMETPTSDYGSMEMIETPSPHTPRSKKRNREQSTPAFTLDDVSDVPILNRSTNSSYKKMKKKLSKGNYSASIVEEWAEKVNSELEDIENFELSVEG